MYVVASTRRKELYRYTVTCAYVLNYVRVSGLRPRAASTPANTNAGYRHGLDNEERVGSRGIEIPETESFLCGLGQDASGVAEGSEQLRSIRRLSLVSDAEPPRR